MIDFIKFELHGANVKKLESNRFLEFKTLVSTATGELSRFRTAYYKGLKFTIIDPIEKYPYHKVTVEGSLHKYWNNGKHNFNDFGAKDILTVLKELKRKFNIIPENSILKQLEIGVNIKTPYPTKKILTSCIQHKKTPFKSIFVKDEGEYIQAWHQRYLIKIYDKRKHYSSKGYKFNTDVMRFEIKYTKMSFWHDKDVFTLEDLLNKDFGLNCVTMLSEKWMEILFYDFEVFDNPNSEHKYSNPIFWGRLNNRQLRHHHNKLKKLIQENSKSAKERINNLILEKDTSLNHERDGLTRIL